MTKPDLSHFLKEWRLTHGARQADLSKLLGVGQGTISKWEAGRELPNVQRMRDVIDFLKGESGRDPFALDVAFIRLQSDFRALFDLDGATLLAVSRGLESMWPTFGDLVGTRMRPHLVGESSVVYQDRRVAAGIRQGEIGVLTGVSTRHVYLSDDAPVKHHWMAAFRRYAGRTVIEMVYQPCDPERREGIERVIRL